MDPLRSETCWSTFKHFIILNVSTYYILCIGWIIQCLIFISKIWIMEFFNICWLLLLLLLYLRRIWIIVYCNCNVNGITVQIFVSLKSSIYFHNTCYILLQKTEERLWAKRIRFLLTDFHNFRCTGKGGGGTHNVDSSWNVMAHGDAREGEVKGKLANGVGSQYSSHYLGTWCIQHYYRWCAHLGCQ